MSIQNLLYLRNKELKKTLSLSFDHHCSFISSYKKRKPRNSCKKLVLKCNPFLVVVLFIRLVNNDFRYLKKK